MIQFTLAMSIFTAIFHGLIRLLGGRIDCSENAPAYPWIVTLKLLWIFVVAFWLLIVSVELAGYIMALIGG